MLSSIVFAVVLTFICAFEVSPGKADSDFLDVGFEVGLNGLAGVRAGCRFAADESPKMADMVALALE